MPEPVMCPGCGESFGDYPAGGKCAKCGASIPAPGAKTGKGIDDELARLGGPAKTCATCGKPIPPGKKSCPNCRVAETSHEHRGMPAWLTLLLVLLFAGVATTVTVYYTKQWGHRKHVDKVKEYIADGRKAAKDLKYNEARILLNSAGEQLKEYFDDDDLDRADLAAEVEQVRKAARQSADDKISEMIQKGDELEAERFYEQEVKEIDGNGHGPIHDRVVRALETRTTMLHFRTAFEDAKKLHADGKLPEALKGIFDLRNELANTKGENIVAMRTQVEAVQKTWVLEAYDAGMKSLDGGKVAEARGFFDLAKQYVSPNDGTLRRKIEDTCSNVAENRVMGLVINVKSVRLAKAEEVKAEIAAHLRKKLDEEGVLSVVLTDRNDARGAELSRLLVADYDEQRGGVFTLPTRGRVTGTKISCTVKVISTKDGRAVWQEKDPVVGETPKTGVPGDSTDATLRADASRRFFISLDAVRVPGRDAMQ